MPRGQWYELRRFIDLVEAVCGTDPEALSVRLRRGEPIYANAIGTASRVLLVNQDTTAGEQADWSDPLGFLDISQEPIEVRAREFVYTLRGLLRALDHPLTVDITGTAEGQATVSVVDHSGAVGESLRCVPTTAKEVSVSLPPAVAAVIANYRWWDKDALVSVYPQAGGYGLQLDRGSWSLVAAGVFDRQAAV
jgi:hypothetical protein